VVACGGAAPDTAVELPDSRGNEDDELEALNAAAETSSALLALRPFSMTDLRLDDIPYVHVKIVVVGPVEG
jgi:hypothetical protein